MNTKKKRTMVEWAMHYRQIIILTTCCLIAFGIYSLPNMRKMNSQILPSDRESS